MIVGYARVSTDGQTLDAQRSSLKAAGAEKVFAEKVSGAKTDRKELAKAIEAIGAGDVLLVTRLDRLARSSGSRVRPARSAAGRRSRRCVRRLPAISARTGSGRRRAPGSSLRATPTSIEHVVDHSVGELGLEPGRFGRHDAARISDRHQVGHLGRIERKGNGHFA